MDGLAAIARLHYDLDTTEAGTLFLFCGRKCDRIKGLLWEGDGYVLVYKLYDTGYMLSFQYVLRGGSSSDTRF